MQPLVGTAIEADLLQHQENRMLALDHAALVAAKANRYLAVAARLTLGREQDVTAAVRDLTPKVTDLLDAYSFREREYERRNTGLQNALENFRQVADKHLGNGK
jgi:hypothetical protein